MNNLDEKEIIDALKRSGYLLESEISKKLIDAGFFVETNQAIKDPFTGKSREVDLIAEYNEFSKESLELNCATKIKFVFEIKNNNAPIVLLTEFKSSPNIDEFEALKEYVTIPENIRYALDPYRNKLLKNRSIFTQYCSFQRKNSSSELMALHPDNIHSGISKINQFCDEEIGEREIIEKAHGYLRHFIYLPILLISDDLFELTFSEQDIPELRKVDSSILVYNYQIDGIPSMTYIFVITKSGFPDFMNSMVELQRNVEFEIINERKKSLNNNGL